MSSSVLAETRRPSLLRNFLENYRTRGPKKTLGLCGYRIRERFREWQLGVQTTGVVPWDQLAAEPDCHSYVATDYDSLDAILRYLEPDDDVLLDYGCGKGRVIALAATRPFRQVIGVELNAELAAVARANLLRIEPKAVCNEVEVVQADATEFAVPSDVTVVFLFNPFSGQVLRAVEDRIRTSLRDNPRVLKVVSLHPSEWEDSLAHCDWLSPEATLRPSYWNECRVTIYRAALD